MFHPWPARWLATLPMLAALTAVSQTVPATPVGNEAQTQLSFRSAFDGYRPFKDEKPLAWKEANDIVRARGGWRAYAEEAEASAVQAPVESGPPAKEADPHAGHAMPAPPTKGRQP